MRKTFAVLMLGLLPAAGLAGGDHADHRHAAHHHASDHHGGNHHAAGASGRMQVAGVGRPGKPARVSRTIEVTMHDTMHFVPDRIEVEAGETVRFFVHNAGDLRHEFILGTSEALAEHAAEMRSHPHMKHAEPHMLSLAPGERGRLVWRFDRTGTIQFACLEPGHFEAGMSGVIEVD